MPPITEIRVAERPPFTEQVEFKCDGKVNLFIGPNATGKSTLIRHIGEQQHRCPCVIIPAARLELPMVNDANGLSSLILDSRDARELDAILADFSSIFDSRLLYHARHVMAERILTKPESPQVVDNYFRALSLSYRCARRICGEILAEELPTDYIRTSRHMVNESVRRADGTLYSRHREAGQTSHLYERMAMSVNHDIEHDPDGTFRKLFMGNLSSGTQGTLSWIQYLALKIASHYNFGSGWESRDAILLVDEIENHLHPTWQRRVIPALLNHFPGLQIFATTHSPFMIAGLKAGQVHRLYRDEEDIVHVEAPNDVDIVGWTMDEILRGLMAVQDPTDEDTARAARELRELRNQGPLTSDAEEDQRQKRIQELRQSVDRDLLAGGVVAAEQELFEQQFSEALERYRQSKGLSLENE